MSFTSDGLYVLYGPKRISSPYYDGADAVLFSAVRYQSAIFPGTLNLLLNTLTTLRLNDDAVECCCWASGWAVPNYGDDAASQIYLSMQ